MDFDQGNNVTVMKFRTPICIVLDGYGAVGDPSCLNPALDCNDSDASVLGAPGEVLNLRFTSPTSLTLDLPAAPGGAVSTLV